MYGSPKTAVGNASTWNWHRGDTGSNFIEEIVQTHLDNVSRQLPSVIYKFYFISASAWLIFLLRGTSLPYNDFALIKQREKEERSSSLSHWYVVGVSPSYECSFKSHWTFINQQNLTYIYGLLVNKINSIRGLRYQDMGKACFCLGWRWSCHGRISEGFIV